MAASGALASAPSPDLALDLHTNDTGDAGIESHSSQPQKQAEAEFVEFDPAKHLSFTPPSGSTLWHSSDTQSVVLFLLSAEEVFTKYHCSSGLAKGQLRGYTAECAPFVYDAWKHPKTLAIVSRIAGVDLVPVMDYEIGHINISVQSEEDKAEFLAAVAQKNSQDAGKNVSDSTWEGKDPIVDWHTDGYHYVCVVIFSDCEDMIERETELRRGNDEKIKVRSPQMTLHRTSSPSCPGNGRAITMVTSFRPRSPAIPDYTVLTTIRPISDLGEMHHQFAEYRFEILEARLREVNKYMRDRKRANRRFNPGFLKRFIHEQIEFLEHMDREIVEDDKVIKGVTGDSHLISEDLKLKQSKKRELAAAE
ncbi:hypothetical protein KXX16_005257 [Aspergillus fumigatus]|uniref:Uncharacterized protein n=1 Tax=Aspergillus fumigatus TaxID=746128 RepID=A0A9P8SUP0_ASPFM|nr:hypothetical protein KXX37_000664 [Aspergillus fumigatus]KAH1655795.1 hypothetical protein KXX16_005257 [Aspergillus fumigatus]KAH1679018.1 hypothetical protein KXX65_003374 [Aspergillus fumigatus]KAH1764906.1 hypothetical protein KXX09_003534 [Aspergillus fumigatus]KAH1768077.1 hypothetical protein KXX41_000094 [Aspergillus fumigatus]